MAGHDPGTGQLLVSDALCERGRRRGFVRRRRVPALARGGAAGPMGRKAMWVHI